MKVGAVVVFNDKVFGPAYAPYYDEYKGKTFRVVGFAEGGHVLVECLEDSEIEPFMCHIDEVEVTEGE
jgi:hypothetical protein